MQALDKTAFIRLIADTEAVIMGDPSYAPRLVEAATQQDGMAVMEAILDARLDAIRRYGWPVGTAAAAMAAAEQLQEDPDVLAALDHFSRTCELVTGIPATQAPDVPLLAAS